MPANFNVFLYFDKMCLLDNLADSTDSGGLRAGVAEARRAGTWGAEWNRGRLKLMVMALEDRKYSILVENQVVNLEGIK